MSKSAKPSIEDRDGGVLLRVRVQPKASRNSLTRDRAGKIRVALTAPPVDGAANEALRFFVAKALGVSRGKVRLISGQKSREKTLHIEGVSVLAVLARLVQQE